MKAAFWSILACLVVVVLLTVPFADLPPSNSVDLQMLRRFYNLSLSLGCIMGIVIGVGLVVHSAATVRNVPEESGSDFNARVAKRGMLGGLLAIVCTFAASLVFAASYPMEPLAPLEKAVTVAHSLLVFDAPAVACAACMLVFAAGSRLMGWSGRYALLPRSIR